MIEAAAPKDEIEGALAVDGLSHTAAMAVRAGRKVPSHQSSELLAFGMTAARLMRAYAKPLLLCYSER